MFFFKNLKPKLYILHKIYFFKCKDVKYWIKNHVKYLMLNIELNILQFEFESCTFQCRWVVWVNFLKNHKITRFFLEKMNFLFVVLKNIIETKFNEILLFLVGDFITMQYHYSVSNAYENFESGNMNEVYC